MLLKCQNNCYYSYSYDSKCLLSSFSLDTVQYIQNEKKKKKIFFVTNLGQIFLAQLYT